MPSYLNLPEFPKHRKRAPGRKPFKVVWHWTGDRTGLSRLQLVLVGDWTQRYATAKAADQALDDWRRGRGTWGAMRRPPEWTATLVPPTAKVS